MHSYHFSLKNTLFFLIKVIILICSSNCMTLYFGVKAFRLTSFFIFTITVAAAEVVYHSVDGFHGKLLWIMSFLLSSAVILGHHLHIEDPYSGLITQNYIISYSARDFLSLLPLSIGFFVFLKALHILCIKVSRDAKPLTAKRIPARSFVSVFIVLFLMWLPRLLCYWPGFFFEDTENSVMQAVGLSKLNNRNPIFYTMFIKLCIVVTGGFKTHDLTAACGLYSCIQLLIIALCLSYSVNRITMNMRKIWTVILTSLYGFSSYISALNIAMWKDPVFCAAVVLCSTLLLEYAVSKGNVSRKWMILYVLSLMLVLFWRNNGFCAVGALLVFLFAELIFMRNKREKLKRLFLLTGISIAFWGIMLLVVYKGFDIGTPKEETSGMMLNQMARVVACDGRMSENEKEYMESILPLDMYADTYRPCCVDLLKWDAHFGFSSLEGSRFYKVWLTMGLKNPKLYFEAWQLQSFGFWSVNCPVINRNTYNISVGNPHNLHAEGKSVIGDYTILFNNLLGEQWRELFKIDSYSVPVGLISWLMLFICVSLMLRNRAGMILALIPQIGLMIGLIIGTPIYYLPRYGAFAQMLLPMYFVILLCTSSEKKDYPE